ncbi:FKBP-type peptidyl-prolyl cis-trans isomerase [soil metagenome]
MIQVIQKFSQLSLAPLLLFLTFLISSCMKEPEDPHGNQAKIDDEILQNYIATNQIQANKTSYGYYYYPIQENEGGKEVANGDIISFYYKMNLMDGTEVASHTPAQGAPIKAKHFSESIFPIGLDLGLHHMKEGEIYKFLLPSSLAYYQYTDNAILPKYANLILEIELINVSKADEQKAEEVALIQEYIQNNQLEGVTVLSSGLAYQVLEAGSGSKPTAMQKVSVSYVGKLWDGTIFDQTTNGDLFSFNLGRQEVIRGWDQGVALMQKSEKARFYIPSYLAYDESVRIVPESLKVGLIESGAVGGFKASVAKSIPPFSILVFDVTLEEIF